MDARLMPLFVIPTNSIGSIRFMTTLDTLLF